MPATAVIDAFRALGDPTRLAVVERLGRDNASTTQLAEPFDMSMPSLLQHLDVLQSVGIVSSQKVGRVRTYRIVPAALDANADWLEHQRDQWTRRLGQLDRYLIGITPTEDST